MENVRLAVNPSTKATMLATSVGMLSALAVMSVFFYKKMPTENYSYTLAVDKFRHQTWDYPYKWMAKAEIGLYVKTRKWVMDHLGV